MLISIAVVRRETEKALQIILGNRPYRIHWLPKSQLSCVPKAGDRNLVLNIPDWLVKQWQAREED